MEDCRPVLWNSGLRRSAFHHGTDGWMGFQRRADCGEIGEGGARGGERKIDIIV